MREIGGDNNLLDGESNSDDGEVFNQLPKCTKQGEAKSSDDEDLPSMARLVQILNLMELVHEAIIAETVVSQH